MHVASLTQLILHSSLVSYIEVAKLNTTQGSNNTCECQILDTLRPWTSGGSDHLASKYAGRATEYFLYCRQLHVDAQVFACGSTDISCTQALAHAVDLLIATRRAIRPTVSARRLQHALLREHTARSVWRPAVPLTTWTTKPPTTRARKLLEPVQRG